MLRRYFSVFTLLAFALFGTLGSVGVSNASERSFAVGAVQTLHGVDYGSPILALTDTAGLPHRIEPDTPAIHKIAGHGPVTPVYMLSLQTNGASLIGFHRRC